MIRRRWVILLVTHDDAGLPNVEVARAWTEHHAWCKVYGRWGRHREVPLHHWWEVRRAADAQLDHGELLARSIIAELKARS